MTENGSLKIEREYKYLVDLNKALEALDADQTPVTEVKIVQGYLSRTKDSLDVRLRMVNNSAYFLTVKEGSGLERTESENEITKRVFENLWKNVKGRVVEKTRLKFKLKTKKGEYVAELDIYKGKNKGLTVMEIEVKKDEVLDITDLPEWVTKDVTGMKEYSNRSLACKGMPK